MRKTFLVLTAGLTVCSLTAQTVDYEQWNKQRILSALTALTVSAERTCETDAVDSSAWAGLQDDIAELHGGPFSPYDGIVFPNYHYVQIEHIVARKEADESGLCDQTEETRKGFAADLLNLTLAPGSLNASKGSMDAYDLQEAEESLFRDNLTDHGLCWWAAQTIRVKSKHGLSVDTSEKTALQSILTDCTEEQVVRPKMTVGADWVFREEFLVALDGEEEITSCATPANEDEVFLAYILASSSLPAMACLTHEPPVDEEEGNGQPPAEDPPVAIPPTPPPPPNPRASQIAAQNACIQTLQAEGENITCGNIEEHCPSVGPIQRGEPLYQPRGTNGRSNDSDDDGVYCESL